MRYIELAFDRVIHQTATAILFDMGEPEGVWIPKKCIDMEEFDPSSNEVPVSEGFAERKGLV